MAINQLNVVLYQDPRRNTATAYLKFPNKQDEIYMGYCLSDAGDYKLSKNTKSKSERLHITGITSAICLGSDDRIHMTIYLKTDTYYLTLMPTYQTPITHKGQWVRQQDFNHWLQEDQPLIEKTADDYFGE